MKIIEGDLLKSDVPAIVHQCNCFNTMGAGIAKKIKELYPQAYEADKKTKYGDKFKLGTFSYAEINKHNLKYIFNLYSQYRYGNKCDTDYTALKDGLNEICYFLNLKNINRLGMPYLIGCGLAGGDPDKVMKIINEVQDENPNIEIEIYKLKE